MSAARWRGWQGGRRSWTGRPATDDNADRGVRWRSEPRRRGAPGHQAPGALVRRPVQWVTVPRAALSR